jgi:hypothetical protein
LLLKKFLRRRDGYARQGGGHVKQRTFPQRRTGTLQSL